MSIVTKKKLDFCICENKGADKLCGNRVILKFDSGFKNRIRISKLTMVSSLPISLMCNFTDWLVG